MNDSPATFADFQAWINYHNKDFARNDRPIRVAMPDGSKAFVSSLFSNDNETVISIVVEKKVQTTEWVSYYE